MRDIFTTLSFRSDATNYLLIPILIFIIILVLCAVLVVYFISRRERIRFVNSQLTDIDSAQVLVN